MTRPSLTPEQASIVMQLRHIIKQREELDYKERQLLSALAPVQRRLTKKEVDALWAAAKTPSPSRKG
jgi:hypothetical protein